MSDITEQLRDYMVPERPLRNKAADEIERLRAALRELIDHCWETEKALTEKGYRMDYCGESLPLVNARTALRGQG